MAQSQIAIEVQKFLSGVDYPASRVDLVGAAEGSGADGRVLDALNALPDTTFESPTDVSEAVSE